MRIGIPSESQSKAFTLIEILVATAVMLLILAMLSSAMGLTFSTVQRAHLKMDQFASARAGFDRVTATLSQATLNTYWDYDNPSTPSVYLRKSDLHFRIQSINSGAGTPLGQGIFFQTPLALESSQPSGLLHAAGYWVEFGENSWRPPHTRSRFRYRLIEAIQRTTALEVFKSANDPTKRYAWQTGVSKVASLSSPGEPGFPIAENLIALVLWPRLPTAQDPVGDQLSPNYEYDSRNTQTTPASRLKQKAQLPPMVQVTMIFINEASAARLESGAIEPNVIREALDGRFRSVASFQADLDAVKAVLDRERIAYLVLSSPVTLRESKWSP